MSLSLDAELAFSDYQFYFYGSQFVLLHFIFNSSCFVGEHLKDIYWSFIAFMGRIYNFVIFHQGEIQKILELGVDQSRIIYANPCKPASHLRLAAKLQIPLMTFDNETELHKISAYYPEAKWVQWVSMCEVIIMNLKLHELLAWSGALLQFNLHLSKFSMCWSWSYDLFGSSTVL